MDISKMINNSIEKYIKENLPQIIEEKVNDMMDSVLGKVLSTYSDHADTIKKQISDKININLDKVKLLDYNAMIAKGVQGHFNKLVSEQDIKPITDMIDEMYGKAQMYDGNEVYIGRVLRDITENIDEDTDYGDDVGFTFICEYNSVKDRYDIRADDDEHTSKSDCSVHLTISGDYERIFLIEHRGFSGRIEHPLLSQKMSHVDKMFYKLYVSGTTIRMGEKLKDDPDYYKDQICYEKEC